MNEFIVFINFNQIPIKKHERFSFLHVHNLSNYGLIYYQNKEYFKAINQDSAYSFSGNAYLDKEQDKIEWAKNNDWIRLTDHPEKRDHWNGAFVMFAYNKNNWLFLNDPLGKRELFYTHDLASNSLIASTRLDWLLYAMNKSEIDETCFPLQWKLKCTLTDNFWIKGIKRINPYGLLSGNESGFKHNSKLWKLPKEQKTDIKKFYDILERNTIFPLLNKQKISLGFTGGVDSRMLFSLLKKQSLKDWQTHFWDNQLKYDYTIAEQIAHDYKIKNRYFSNYSLNKFDRELFTNRIIFNRLASKDYNYLRTNYLQELSKENYILMDGGLGALCRQKIYLKQNYYLKLFPNNQFSDKFLNFYSQKSFFGFNQDLTVNWEQTYYQNLRNYLNSIEPLTRDNQFSWLNILYIQFVQSQCFSVDQQYIDNFIVNYTPYANLNVINELYSISKKLIKNNKIVDYIFKNSDYKLVKYPISVENTKTSMTNKYLYNVNNLCRKITNRFNKNSISQYNTDNIEYLLDSFNSLTARNSGYFDNSVLDVLVSKAYKENNYQSICQLSELYEFETWRLYLSNPYQIQIR